MRRVPMGQQSGGLHSKGGELEAPPAGNFPASPAGRCQGAEAKVRRGDKESEEGRACWVAGYEGLGPAQGCLAACQASLLSAPAFSDCVGRSPAGHEAQVRILTAPSADSGP